MILKNQIFHLKAERDVLSSANNPWIVELKCSFQVTFYYQKIGWFKPLHGYGVFSWGGSHDPFNEKRYSIGEWGQVLYSRDFTSAKFSPQNELLPQGHKAG